MFTITFFFVKFLKAWNRLLVSSANQHYDGVNFIVINHMAFTAQIIAWKSLWFREQRR